MLEKNHTTLPWQKLSGAGNTFILLGPEVFDVTEDIAELTHRLCDSKTGVGGGADGLIVTAPTDDPTRFTMHYYNNDGSTGMMCGNGARCAVRHAIDHGFVIPDDRKLTLANAGVSYQAEVIGEEIRIGFPDPVAIRTGIETRLGERTVTLDYVDVGTPHLLWFVGEDLDRLDIDTWGPLLRHHVEAGKGGANANFLATAEDRSELRLRTYERGVEGETGACGTGAIASALVGSLRYDLPSPIQVIPTSGERLRIGFVREGESFREITLQGPAVVLDEGMVRM